MTTTILVLARTLHIGSAMLLVALPYFLLIILRPYFAAETDERHASFCRKMVGWFWIALIVEAISGALWFWLVTAQMSDQSPWGVLDPADLGTVLWQTQFGQLWLVRTIIVVLLCVTFYFTSRRKTLPSSGASFLDWLVLTLSGCLLVTLAWAGHAAAGIHYQTLHLVADLSHLLIGSIWPMGLIPLAGFLWQINRCQQTLPDDLEIRVLQRFSQISLVAVVILVATGLINGWLMVGSWEALVTTTYGRLLLGKVLVVGIMIALGAFNRFRLLPHLPNAPIKFQTLQGTILVESCLAVIILIIVGIMGMTSPPS